MLNFLIGIICILLNWWKKLTLVPKSLLKKKFVNNTAQACKWLPKLGRDQSPLSPWPKACLPRLLVLAKLSTDEAWVAEFYILCQQKVTRMWANSYHMEYGSSALSIVFSSFLKGFHSEFSSFFLANFPPFQLELLIFFLLSILLLKKIKIQACLWLSKLGWDISKYRAGIICPLVEIGLRWLPKLSWTSPHVPMPLGAPGFFQECESNSKASRWQ